MYISWVILLITNKFFTNLPYFAGKILNHSICMMSFDNPNPRHSLLVRLHVDVLVYVQSYSIVHHTTFMAKNLNYAIARLCSLKSTCRYKKYPSSPKNVSPMFIILSTFD